MNIGHVSHLWIQSANQLAVEADITFRLTLNDSTVLEGIIQSISSCLLIQTINLEQHLILTKHTHICLNKLYCTQSSRLQIWCAN